MSDKVGYEGRANAELYKIEYNEFSSKGVDYKVYKITTILKELWDSTLEEYVKYEDSDFNAKSFNVFGEYTLWLGAQIREGDTLTATQKAKALIQKVFDIEINNPEEFLPNTLMERLKGKKCNVSCSVRDEKYTKVDFLNNIDGVISTKDMPEGEKKTLIESLLSGW